MVKQIIKEAMDQNPLGLKEAVEAELQKRVTLALEAKMKKMKEEDDEEDMEDDDEDEDEMDDEDEDMEDEDLDENFASAKPKFKEGDIVSINGEKSTYQIVGVGALYDHPNGKFRSYEILKVTLDKDGNASGRNPRQQTGFANENTMTLVKSKK